MIKRVARNLVFNLNLLYKQVYFQWRIQELGAQFHAPLKHEERVLYLQFCSALRGRSLVVYDIGAASGAFSGCLAKLPNVRAVHAFEPIPSAFAELQKRMQPYAHVTCHNVAVGESNTQLDILVVEGSRDSSSLLQMRKLHKDERPGVSYDTHPERVTVVPLDGYVREYNLPQPSVVKVDVQGYEDRVLRGGAQTIRQADHVILEMSFEALYEGSPLFDDIYQQMRGMGFRMSGTTGELLGKSGSYLQVDGIFRNERLLTREA